MKTNLKSAVSLVTVFSAIVFGNAIADTPKPVNVFAMQSSHATIASPVSTRVVGESLDSGLGDLPSTYSAAEFQRSTTVVAGESQDSGLGDLPANYTGAEFQRPAVLVASTSRESVGQLSR